MSLELQVTPNFLLVNLAIFNIQTNGQLVCWTRTLQIIYRCNI